MSEQVAMRELKARLSECLSKAKAGHIFVITERGEAVARLEPPVQTLEARLEQLERAGILIRGTGKIPAGEPLATVLDGHSVADLLIEDRE